MRDHGFTEEQAHAAALLADGSIERALEGDTEGFAEARQKAFAMLRAVAASPQPAGRLSAAKLIGGERDELASRLQLLASMLRGLGLLAARGDERELANRDLRGELERLLPAFAGERPVRAFSAVARALSALERNGSPKIVADWVALQL